MGYSDEWNESSEHELYKTDREQKDGMGGKRNATRDGPVLLCLDMRIVSNDTFGSLCDNCGRIWS